MKNISPLVILTLLITACNPTRNELKISRRAEKKFAYAQAERTAGADAAKSELFASSKKIIVIDDNFYDSLQRKATREQMDKIEKDKAESFQSLRKIMITEVYPAVSAIDAKRSPTTIKQDTAYSVKGSGWYVVE